MGLAIAHRENDIVVIDLIREICAPFKPESAVEDFVAILKQYRISSATADRYGAEWVRGAFSRHGVRLEPSKLSASELYVELLPAINTGRVSIIDNSRAVNQICALERKTGRGKDIIDHPRGGFDDLSVCIAGVVYHFEHEHVGGVSMTGYISQAGISSGNISWGGNKTRGIDILREEKNSRLTEAERNTVRPWSPQGPFVRKSNLRHGNPGS